MKSKDKLGNTKRGGVVQYYQRSTVLQKLWKSLSPRQRCAMPRVLGEAKLGSKTEVSALTTFSNIRMEKDQKETADKEDSLEWAEDLEMTG